MVYKSVISYSLVLLLSILFHGISMVYGNYNAKRFTLKEGFPESVVKTLYTDTYGLLWIGTDEGLYLYNGYEFKLFRQDPNDIFSISNNHVLSVFGDHSGNIWVGTKNGLNLFNRKTGKFLHYSHNPDDSASISHRSVLSVLPFHNGEIYIKTEGYIECLDTFSSETIKYPHYFKSDNRNSIPHSSQLVADHHGKIWFGTKDGLFSFSIITKEFNHYVNNPDDPFSISHNQVNCLFKDGNGVLWIGTSGGIDKYNPLNNQFISYRANGQKSISIFSITENQDGILWLGTSDGLFSLDKGKETICSVQFGYNQPGVYNQDEIQSLTFSSSGILWYGSKNGLGSIDTKPFKFKLFNATDRSPVKLSGNSVSAIYKDKNHDIYCAVWDHGIDVIDSFNDIKDRLYKENPDPMKRTGTNNVRCFWEDTEGYIWIGGNEGIDIYDKVKAAVTPVGKKYEFKGLEFFKERIVYTITGDRMGNMWFGTDRGVVSFNPLTGIFKYIPEIVTETSNKLVEEVYTIVHQSDSAIWIGSESGLYAYNPVQGALSDVNVNRDFSNSANIPVNTLLIDSKSNLWIGTDAGLVYYEIPENKSALFTISEGLLNNTINSVLEDENHFIWLSTDMGLSRFDPNKGEFFNFFAEEGLQDYRFNQGAGFKSSNGELFFGGVSGFNSFLPQEIKINESKPGIIIWKVLLVQKKIQEVFYTLGEKAVITAGLDHVITIFFASTDYTLPVKNQFKYSISPPGKPGNWMDLGYENEVSLSGMKPGKYILKVIGSNIDGVWNTQGNSLEIIIEAPFWRTTAAYFIYFILLILLVYTFSESRTVSLRRSNRVLRNREIIARQVQRQKEQLSLRNKNIEDSLNYARRIQQALFTTQKAFKSVFPDSFILHEPKDIVSGDFYWIFERDNKVFLSAADCTGHGVPGAFMSIIGFELFRKIIVSQKITDPAEILTQLNQNFEEIFGGENGDIIMNDGMDLAFCVFDKKTSLLEFAGAFNPVYIIRDDKLIELKAERFSIGADRYPEVENKKTFSSHKFQLAPDDMLYMFSDGFPDQFGGPDGKKFKYRRFRHLLLTIHNLPLDKQRQYLKDSIEEWRGNFDQVDDILVIGIKPSFKSNHPQEAFSSSV